MSPTDLTGPSIQRWHRPSLVGGLAALLLVLLPWLGTLSPFVLSILMQAATYGIAVLGMVVVLGYTGQINLGQAAFFGFGAYSVALGTTVYGLGFWPALLIGILISSIVGAALGMTTMRLGGHYLAMITISFQQIFDLVAVNWIDVTHGPDGVAGIGRPSVGGIAFNDDRAYLSLCFLVLACMIALVAWLPHTRWGRAMCSIRDNELAAEVVGVPTLSVKIGAFTLCAALGAMGGGLYAAGFSYISPDNFNFSRAIEFLSMVLLGGAQSPFGGVIGTTLLILLPEWLKEMPKSLQFIKDVYLVIYGLAVILIMVFMPQGIWGLLRARFGTRSVMPMPAAKLSFHAKDDAHAVLLQVSGLSKYFGGLRAVDGLDLTVRRGTIHALIGPNGSGKTTTLNLISGIYSPSSGSMHVEDIDVTRKAPHQRAALGLGRTFQNIRLFSSMSVLENVVIGGQRRGNPIQPGEHALTQRAHAALAFVGLDDKCADLASQLPYGHQRLVEIARSIAGQPKLLLLDEPAAGLNQTEKGQLVELLRRLRDEHGLTILLIDHDMRLVERVSDVITVLNFGKKIAEGTPTEVLQDPAVIAAYLGDTSGVS